MAKAPGKSKSGKITGRWITTLEGYRAFHPNPLPPSLDWTPTLANALSDSSMLIGRLAGEGRRLPNPHILIRPFIRREAVFSSRIEGTQATLGELLAVEAGATVERSPDDLREVGNYVKALEHGMKRLESPPLSLRLVKELTGTKVALQLLGMVAGNPFLTPRGAQDKLGLAYNTVMRAIGQLEKRKVMKKVSEAKRDRVYCAKAILDILEEPARLTLISTT